MITFYFVRHGQTLWNSSGRYQGATDVPLSEIGKEQAEKAAAWFRDVHLDAVYSSDLSRAKDTAETIARTKGLSVSLHPGLREISFGDWEGLTYDEIEARWSGGIEAMYNHPATVRISGGESFGDVEKRTMAAMKDIIAEVGMGDNGRGDEWEENGKTVLIVSHGGALRTIFCGLLGITVDKAWDFCQANANISCIKYYGNRNLLFLLNSTDHLK